MAKVTVRHLDELGTLDRVFEYSHKSGVEE